MFMGSINCNLTLQPFSSAKFSYHQFCICLISSPPWCCQQILPSPTVLRQFISLLWCKGPSMAPSGLSLQRKSFTCSTFLPCFLSRQTLLLLACDNLVSKFLHSSKSGSIADCFPSLGLLSASLQIAFSPFNVGHPHKGIQARAQWELQWCQNYFCHFALSPFSNNN